MKKAKKKPSPTLVVRAASPFGDMNPEVFKLRGDNWLMDAVFFDNEGNIYINGRKIGPEEAIRWATDILDACRHAKSKKKSK